MADAANKGRIKFKEGQIVKVHLKWGHQYARRFFKALGLFLVLVDNRIIKDCDKCQVYFNFYLWWLANCLLSSYSSKL